MTRKIILLLILAFTIPTGYAQSKPRKIDIVITNGDPAMEGTLRSELDLDLPPAETRFQALQRARNAEDRLSDYLNSVGYLDAFIRPGVDDETGLVPRVEVDTGPLFRISAIKVFLDDPEQTSKRPEQPESHLSLKEGDAAIPSKVLANEQRVLAGLKAEGYAFASSNERQVYGDAEAGTIEVEYHFNAGPRVVLGETHFEDGQRTRKRFLERLVPYEKGDLYDPEIISDFQSNLTSAQLFGSMSIVVDEAAAGVTPEGDEIHDVNVTLSERARHTIATGVSFSTSEGVGLTVSWTKRNASRRGDVLELSTTIASLERSADAKWRFPNLFGYGRDVTLNSALGRDETDAYDRNFLNFGATLELRQSPELTYALGAASEFSQETDAVEERDLQVLSISGAVRIDQSDNLLDPTEGWRADIRTEPGIVTGDGSANFVLTSADFRGYVPFGREDRFVAAGRLRTGFVIGADAVELPTSRRFYSGGGGSARGYAYQSIGPQDADGQALGGRSLLETSMELRYRYSNTLGFVGFLDAASVTKSSYPSADELRYGAGIGVRYYTSIGPFRVDIATPFDPREGDDPVQVYISLGQAF